MSDPITKEAIRLCVHEMFSAEIYEGVSKGQFAINVAECLQEDGRNVTDADVQDVLVEMEANGEIEIRDDKVFPPVPPQGQED